MVFSEVKAAVDLVKDLAELLRKAGNYDPDVLNKFNDLRGKVLSAYETEIELLGKIRQLEQDLELKKMSYDADSGLYYQDDEDGKREYFCQRCADMDNKSVRVQTERPGLWRCFGCDCAYQTQASRAATRAAIQAHNEKVREERLY